MIDSLLSSLQSGGVGGRTDSCLMAFRDCGQDTAERTGSLCVVIENDFLSTWSHKLREEEKEEALPSG